MKFYRPVEKIDFEKAEKDYDDLAQEARDFIRQEGNILKAVNFLYENYSYSKKQAREVCNDYWSFLKARDDFRRGKKVFVEY